jgi:2-aminoadipate transaminase
VWVGVDGLDSEGLDRDARERGVLFSRGGLFHVGGGGRDTLRLAWSVATPDQIESGIATLGALMKKRIATRGRAAVDEVSEGIPIL